MAVRGPVRHPVDAATDLVMRGAAHDLNNMLAVIASGLTILERGGDKDRRAAIFQGMHRAVANAVTLARDIVSLAGEPGRATEFLAVASVFDGLAVFAEETLGSEIVLEIQVAEGLWPIRAVRAYLELALINLLVNAADAMPAGGAVTLRASNTFRRSGAVGDFVRIEVIDTGEGISQSIIDRVFEPFFTTKPATKGSGLGLGQVRRFVVQHGGDVTIESVVGAGTTVILHLPRAQPGT